MFTSPLLSYLAAKSTDKSGGATPLKLTDFGYFCYKGYRRDVISEIDTSAGTVLDYMFTDDTVVSTAPYFDTSAATSIKGMFKGCTSLVNIPDYDFSGVKFFPSLFMGCTSLVTAPQLNLPNATWAASAFRGCTSLTAATRINIPKATMVNELFYGCTALTTVSGLDLSSVTDAGWMFINCSALTDLYVYNISTNLTIGSGTAWGHLLTVDSIVNTIKELVTSETAKTLSMGSANLEKIANLYCKVTDNTNPKITMELCESTDEGAMLLSEYAALKNWQFA